MKSTYKRPMTTNRYVKVAAGAALVTLPLLIVMSGQTSAQTPWTKPVPKAECGLSDWVETGLQGHTTLAERETGDSELGYNCNLELVGQWQGEGMWWFGGGNWTSFGDCAYYSTRNEVSQERRGVVVIDASDPTNPHPTAYLDDTNAMLNAHESLKVHQKRKLLAADQSTTISGPNFAVYDLSGDCRYPVLKANLDLPGTFAHAGNFTPDGMTYYITPQTRNAPPNGVMPILDVSDPANPKEIVRWRFADHGIPHDVTFNSAGTRLYSPQSGQIGNPARGPNGLVISDVSDIQFRRPNPQIRVVGTLFWQDGGIAQSALPVTINGRPHIIFADEAAGAITIPGTLDPGGREASCNLGLPASGFARIIDITDETNPKLVSKLMLEAHDPANCAELLTTPGENRQSDYSAHYCMVDKVLDAKMVACSYFGAGIRVFDIHDPYHPKEIAYYKPPGRRTAFLPASSLWATNNPDRTVDFTPSDIRWRNYQGEIHLWFSSADNGFQILRFTKSRRELLKNVRLFGKDLEVDD
jgi:hypothetical protein